MIPMIPDKIYLNKYMIRPGMLHPAQYPADTLEVEYIRKDALLEWAKAYKEEADAAARGKTDNPSWGERVAMRALIDKINSL